MNKLKNTLVIFSVFLLSAIGLTAQETGVISGKIIDKENGDELIGARVQLLDTKKGAISKIDGTYQIKDVPVGIYSLKFTYIGYASIEVKDVKVEANDVTKIDIGMDVESIMSDDIVVTAKAIQNTETALLKDRQKSNSVSDAISSEMISQTGSGNAAEALTKVTGVSAIDGKHIYVRGLGDRYTHTQLNGASLASTDPDKNSVSTDIFSSDFIENIVTTKSFTPDKPGNFTGGTVDIKTKSFPEKETFSFNISSTYNDQSTLSDEYLTYDGGNTDWLGIDDGTRELPSYVRDAEIPNDVEARFDPDKAEILDKTSKAFAGQMSPEYASSGVNQSYSLSYGNSFNVFENQMGIILGLNYDNKYSLYNNAVSSQFQLKGKENDELHSIYDLNDSRGKQNVNWGSLMNLSYAVSSNNTISLNLMHNKDAEKLGRFLSGNAETLSNPDAVYETRTISYQERDVTQVQLSGDHNFTALNNAKIDWTATYNNSQRDEPDLRFFTNHYIDRQQGDSVKRFYNISQSQYSLPAHYFRNLNESINEYNLNYLQPLKLNDGYEIKLKVGGTYSEKSREMEEFIYKMQNKSGKNYNGNPDEFFSPENVGIIDTSNGRTSFGNFIIDETQPQNNYTGSQKISAFYAMVDLPITDDLKFVGGARMEITEIDVKSQDSSKNFSPEGDELGVVNNEDVLPSVNFIYEVAENMNLRLSYGKTLARPSFRELAPFPSFDYIGGYILNGNQDLKRSKIDNYDFRWEWFYEPGKIIAASVFYKNFTNPIEIAIVSNNNQTQYQNVPKAELYGLELEARSDLSFISNQLEKFSIGGNLTIMDSKVDIPEKTLLSIRELQPDAPATRPMHGQSPYLLNLIMGYNNNESGTNVNLSYNFFDDRLSKVSLGGTPNVFEFGRGNLDINLKQELTDGIHLKLSGSNLLDPTYEEGHKYNDKIYHVSRYQLGRNFKIGFNFSM